MLQKTSSVPGLTSMPLDARFALENISSLLGAKVKVGMFSRGTTTGTQVISGIGFRPRAIIMLSRFGTVLDNAMSTGFTDLSSTYCVSQSTASAVSSDSLILSLTSGSWYVRATISSVSDDSFMLTYSNADLATMSYYLCIG